MAKLYRYPEGGGFYDAFGGKLGEVENIWCGDSFDRDSTACAYNVTSSSTDDEFIIATGSANERTSNLYCSGNIRGVDLAIDGCDSLSMELKKIQAQFDELKKNFVPKTSAHDLRSALKTLQYKREVE